VKAGLSMHIFCIVRFVIGVKLVDLIGRFSDDQYLPQFATTSDQRIKMYIHLYKKEIFEIFHLILFYRACLQNYKYLASLKP